MKKERAIAIRRVLAFAMDWLVVALWGGVLFGAVMIATNGNPPQPENPWQAQAIGFLTMTLPVTLYFALCESSAMRASLGKRVLGLIVSRETGGRLAFRSRSFETLSSSCRGNLAHLAQQAAFSGEGGFPAWVWGPAIVALVGPLWWLVAIVVRVGTPAIVGLAHRSQTGRNSTTRTSLGHANDGHNRHGNRCPSNQPRRRRLWRDMYRLEMGCQIIHDSIP